MAAASEICQLLASCAQSEMAAPHVQHMVCLFLQQANGKIDRTRSIAFSCLQLLLNCKYIRHVYNVPISPHLLNLSRPHLKGIPHRDRLASLFQELVLVLNKCTLCYYCLQTCGREGELVSGCHNVSSHCPITATA